MHCNESTGFQQHCTDPECAQATPSCPPQLLPSSFRNTKHRKKTNDKGKAHKYSWALIAMYQKNWSFPLVTHCPSFRSSSWQTIPVTSSCSPRWSIYAWYEWHIENVIVRLVACQTGSAMDTEYMGSLTLSHWSFIFVTLYLIQRAKIAMNYFIDEQYAVAFCSHWYNVQFVH